MDALLGLLRREGRAHPGYRGGAARASQQLRQSTPPAGVSVEAAQAVRQASVKLFQQLGLRDYAQFSGWVLPARALEAQVAAAAGGAEEQQGEQQQGEQQRPMGRSFAELQAINEELRQGAGGGGAGISAADRAGALDTTAASPSGAAGGSSLLAGELALAEAEAAAARSYGTYNGIVIDEGVRPVTDETIDAAGRLSPDAQ